jgi:hypothetical protein
LQRDAAAPTIRYAPQNICVLEDLEPVIDLISGLRSRSISVWVFGGWAEQLRGLRAPGVHCDIDLLYPGHDWGDIDALIATESVREVAAKRSSHKRAIIWREVMVELFLVRCDDRGPHTIFWDRVRHDWPTDVFGFVASVPVASIEALRSYRSNHEALGPRDKSPA